MTTPLKLLSIDNGALVAFDGDVPTVLHTTADIDALLAREDDVLRSSALDFPADYTDSTEVLALVRYLNSLT
jgi:hypothetical protein